MHARHSPVYRLSRKINKYILIPSNNVLAFPAAKTRAPRHMVEKKPKVIILSRTHQNPLVNNTDTKEGKIAAYKKM